MANAKFKLQPNESIIMKSEGITHNNNNIAGELVLTNLNLIHVVPKGFLRTTYATEYYPINQIKVFNGKASVILGQLGKLEIYFINGSKAFSFYNPKEAKRMAASINELLTGEKGEFDSGSSAIPGTEFIAETLKGTVDTFKNVFGGRGKTKSSDQSDANSGHVTGKCTSCGAPTSGIRGQIVRCIYCNSDQQL